MTTYFTTRSLNDVDASEVRSEDRIIHLVQLGSPPGFGPSDGRVVEVAVEGAWTGERVRREPPYPAPGSPSFRSEDGTTIVVANHQIGLTWPGAEAGAPQVFIHPDWPGSFHSVNLAPSFWDKDLLTIDDIRLRAELLPDDPRPIPGVPQSGFRTSCLCCYDRTDLRFSFGHAWREGDVVFRIGTSEIIAHADGNGMIREDGPYCGTCIDAAFQVDLRLPEGREYERNLNRSLSPGEDIPDQAKPFHQPADLVGSGMSRYGRDAYEWSLETDPAACRERLDRARVIFAAWKRRRRSSR